MIGIKELSVGNYLRVAREGLCIKKGTIIKINEINAENKFTKKGLVGAIYCHPLDEDQLDGGIWLAYLEPIEITPEILEKNGIVWDAEIQQYVWKYDGYYISCDLHGKTRIYVGNDYVLGLPLPRVHQLQNALTLCGINKEIEL